MRHSEELLWEETLEDRDIRIIMPYAMHRKIDDQRYDFDCLVCHMPVSRKYGDGETILFSAMSRHMCHAWLLN